MVVKLPKLRQITYKNKKNRYHISASTQKRRKAINEGVRKEKKKTKKNMRKAAIAKKARFNVLRIYRRYKNPEECEILTKDMKYMDKKYKLGTTKNICKKTKQMKGGNQELIADMQNLKLTLNNKFSKINTDLENLDFKLDNLKTRVTRLEISEAGNEFTKLHGKEYVDKEFDKLARKEKYAPTNSFQKLSTIKELSGG